MQELKWSNPDYIPRIGDQVKIRVNRIGNGAVTGYFSLEGWLGVHVKLDTPFQGNETVEAFGAEIFELED